jgi:hypothetical protein
MRKGSTKETVRRHVAGVDAGQVCRGYEPSRGVHMLGILSLVVPTLKASTVDRSTTAKGTIAAKLSESKYQRNDAA